MKVKDHYDKHLGRFYSWMLGDFDIKQREQEAFFHAHNVVPSHTKVAFDLGAGNGIQAVSLAKIGFSVKAVDFSNQLLDELLINKKAFPIEIIHSDVLDFLKNENSKADAIVCMGDTITHLPNIEDVETLIKLSSTHLVGNGKIIFSFRDLTNELRNEERFIPVKQDAERILLCFLEYFRDHVMVHDIFYEKENNQWLQKISSYPKLRLNENSIESLLTKNRFKIVSKEVINRMIYLIAEKC